jgi:hypothetical protein
MGCGRGFAGDIFTLGWGILEHYGVGWAVEQTLEQAESLQTVSVTRMHKLRAGRSCLR